MGDEQRLDVAIAGCLAVGERSVILAERLVFGDVRKQVGEVLQVRETVGQRTNGKVFARERLQHKYFTLIYKKKKG